MQNYIIAYNYIYSHSFYQTEHITLWWMVVGVNWLWCVKSATGKCFGPVMLMFWASYAIMFLLCTSELFSIRENKLIGYAHDPTFI